MFLLFSFILLLVNQVAAEEAHCPVVPQVPCNPRTPYRSYDGTCNNLENPLLGSAMSCVVRLLKPQYEDGMGHFPRLTGVNGNLLPNARVISNEYCADRGIFDPNVTAYFPLTGMVLGPDLSTVSLPRTNRGPFPCCVLKEPVPTACNPISIPPNDPFYSQYGETCLNIHRSFQCNQCTNETREQNNPGTSYLDVTPFYGITGGHVHDARTFEKGLFMVSRDAHGRWGLLPKAYEDNNLILDDNCDPKFDRVCFKIPAPAGPNTTPILVAFATIFLRQHNHVARALLRLNPHWDDERVFQETRRIIIAQWQINLFNEFFPLLVGHDLMTKYDLYLTENSQYDPEIDPQVLNEVGGAAGRWGHTMVHPVMQLINEDGEVEAERELKNSFMRPIDVQEGRLDLLVRGMTRQAAHAFDPFLIDDVRHFMYRMPHGENGMPFGQDLTAANIQRGRDHGYPGYVHYVTHLHRHRPDFPQNGIRDFADLHFLINDQLINKLSEIYEHVEDIDLWIGGISERSIHDAILGPTFAEINAIQYHRAKFGDRFFVTHANQAGSFTPCQLKVLLRTTISGVICANADNLRELQPNPFLQLSEKNPLRSCSKQFDIAKHLRPWRDSRSESQTCPDSGINPSMRVIPQPL